MHQEPFEAIQLSLGVRLAVFQAASPVTLPARDQLQVFRSVANRARPLLADARVIDVHCVAPLV